MSDSKTVIYDDINFAVIHRPISEYNHDFKVYEIAGVGEDGIPYRVDETSNIVAGLDEDVTYLCGHIQWDGCSNWVFDEQERLHFCSVEGGKNIGILFERLYEIARNEIPGWID